jgi:peptidoglycan hydrolase-like protein with peptidoglycan-binding domain
MSDTPFDTTVNDEPVVESAPIQSAKTSTPQPKRTPSPAGQVFSGQPVDGVYLSMCIFKNMNQRKSLTLHHIQRRLEELGYQDAALDYDGFYGDLTKAGVAAYQKDYGLAGDGVLDMATLESIFQDDPNVEVRES